MATETTTTTKPKTMSEISADIQKASEQLPPEAKEAGNTDEPMRSASPADEKENSPVDGEVVEPAEPQPKTPEELKQDPKAILNPGEVDKNMFEEMKAADTPDGDANRNEDDKKPRTMNDVIGDIKNAHLSAPQKKN